MVIAPIPSLPGVLAETGGGTAESERSSAGRSGAGKRSSVCLGQRFGRDGDEHRGTVAEQMV